MIFSNAYYFRYIDNNLCPETLSTGRNRKRIVLFVVTTLFFVLITQLQFAYAVTTVEWDSVIDPDEQNLNDGAVGSSPVTFTIIDTDLAADPAVNTIDVLITSTKNPSGILLTLTETGGSSGTFTNTNLVFTNGTALFPVTGTVTATRNDPDTNLEPGFDPGIIDTIPAPVVSTTDSALGITLELVESGPNTGFFTGTLGFSSVGPSDDINNILHVSTGDIVSLVDPVSGQISNALIIPNPDPSLGAIEADIGDTITATYNGVSDVLTVVAGVAGGGGGGGLIRTELVLEILAQFGGGGGDTTPPQFTLGKSILTSLSLPQEILQILLLGDPFVPIQPLSDANVDFPFSINGKGFALSQYSNTIETHVQNTGEPMIIKLNFQDASGLEHLAFYTNLREFQREIADSDTYITYDSDKLEVTDPHGYFSSVNYTEYESGLKYAFLFNITFAKPMEKSDIIIRAWDILRNSADTKIFDAIQVVGEPIIDDSLQIELNQMTITNEEKVEFITYLPDSHGNLFYYNSFGQIEHKIVHPYTKAVDYPENVGRLERHDKEFWQQLPHELIKAESIAQNLIKDPFIDKEDSLNYISFPYPSNVGKLDRENVNSLKLACLTEENTAHNSFKRLYATNQVAD